MYVSQVISDYNDRFSNIKDFVLYSLGWPVIKVELTPEALNIAIMDAVTKYYDRAAMPLAMRLVTVEDGNVVTIPTDIKPSKIENVIFPEEIVDSFSRAMMVTGTEDALGKYVIPLQSWDSLLQNFDMVGYMMFLMRLEDFKKLVGIDRTWDIANGKLHLYPVAARMQQCGIVYKDNMSDEEMESEIWVRNWALAKAKHMLGTIRSRMSGFQVGGGNIGVDGDALKAEAKEEMGALEEELRGLQKPLPIMQI